MSDEKDIVTTNSSKIKFRILFFLSIILISAGIFTTSYYTSINKVYSTYESSLINDMNEITEINKTVAVFNNNQTIDIDYAKEQLPNIIESLYSLRVQFETSDPISKYKKDHQALKSGLDNNLLIYRKSLSILNNPWASDIEESMEDLKTYRNDCMDSYATINIKNNRITLPQISLTFIDNLFNYSYSAFMAKKETDIKQQQIQDFINKIDGLCDGFLDIKINYYSYALKVRKKEMTYNDLLSMIEDNSTKLSNLKTDFNKNFSVPNTAMPTYETFKPLLELYALYLSDFKLALTSEKVQTLNALVDESTLDVFYNSSNIKFNEITNYYDNFIKVYMDLKHDN